MGPYPHDAARAVISDDNPMGNQAGTFGRPSGARR